MAVEIKNKIVGYEVAEDSSDAKVMEEAEEKQIGRAHV